MSFRILFQRVHVKYTMPSYCEKHKKYISKLIPWSTYLIFFYSLFLTNVTCSSQYLSHKIRHRSIVLKNSIDVQKSVRLSTEQRSEASYEYPGDYSLENDMPSSLLSNEHKVQNQLLKDNKSFQT